MALSHQKSENDGDEERDLASLLNRLGLTDIDWRALQSHFGFAGSFSYLPSAATAEQRHQAVRAAKQLSDYFWTLISAMQVLDATAKEAQGTGTSRAADQTIRLYVTALLQLGWRNVHDTDVEHILLALRVLSDANGIFGRWFPYVTAAACDLPSADCIVLTPPSTSRAKEATPSSYRVLAQSILASSRAPMHYKDIGTQMEAAKVRPNVNLRHLKKVLSESNEAFISLGSGTYGLKSWNLERDKPYTVLLKEALEAAGKPMTYGQLFQLAQARRSFRESSLKWCLERGPRFYRSVNGIYGLREWLSVRRKQNLRTPEAFREDIQSYRRLKRKEPIEEEQADMEGTTGHDEL